MCSLEQNVSRLSGGQIHASRVVTTYFSCGKTDSSVMLWRWITACCQRHIGPTKREGYDHNSGFNSKHAKGLRRKTHRTEKAYIHVLPLLLSLVQRITSIPCHLRPYPLLCRVTTAFYVRWRAYEAAHLLSALVNVVASYTTLFGSFYRRRSDDWVHALAGPPSRGRRVLPSVWWRTHEVVRYSERSSGPAGRRGSLAVAGAVGPRGRVVVNLFRDKLEELAIGDVVVSTGVLPDCHSG